MARRHVWLFPLVAILGCSTVGVEREVSLPGDDSFERALVDYVRGDLDAADLELERILAGTPGDRRASDLLREVREENGGKREVTEAPTAALPSPAGPKTLLAEALTRNPEVRQELYRVVEARAKLREANVAFGPEFNLLTRFHPLGLLTSLTQSLIEGAIKRGAAMDREEAGCLTALSDYATTRADVADRTLTAYLDLQEATEIAAALEEERKAWEEQVRVASTLVDEQKLLPAELLAKKAGLARAEQRIAEARSRAAEAKAALNTLMARPATDLLDVTKEAGRGERPDDVRAAIAKAMEGRPERAGAGAEVEGAEAERRLVAAQEPKVELYGSYGWSKQKQESQIGRNWRFGARTSIPLLIIPLQAARDAQEAAVIRQLEVEIERIDAEIALEAVSGFEEVARARAAERASLGIVTAAEEAVRSFQGAARWAESAPPFTLRGMEAQLAEAKADLVVKRIAVERASLRLQRAMGILPEKVLFERRAAAPASPWTGRALWVWDVPPEGDEAALLVDLARARGVTVLFFSTRVAVLSERPAAFRDLIRGCRGAGIEVQALGGDPSWARLDGRAGAERFLDAVLSYQAASAEEERFSAVHLDVEPHTTAEWREGGRAALVDGYLSLLSWAKGRAAEGGLALAIDVPPGWEEVPAEGGTLLSRAIAEVDEVAVMAYRRTARGALDVSGPAVEAAAGKRAWVGVDASASEARTEGEFERFLREVEAGGAGVAIHDLHRYRRLILGGDGR